MRIVHLVAGAGGMYCGSCLHGNALAAAMQRAGHDVSLVPLYTPLRAEGEDASLPRVAMGGINVYLQQQSGLFAWLPRPLRRLLDHPRLLRWAARRGGATRPDHLGPLCLSMLRGEEGRQRAELDALVGWLGDQLRPELIHLNNALLAGLARTLRRRLGVPVVCSLSGEDVFLERLPEPHRTAAKAELRQRVGDCAALAAMSEWYADFAADYLAVPRNRITVLPPGIDIRGYTDRTVVTAAGATAGSSSSAPFTTAQPTPATIGFLGRICSEKGLHTLVEAAARLAQQGDTPPFRLAAAGHLDPGERPYRDEVRQRAVAAGLGARFRDFRELDRAGKLAFLGSLGILCLPSTLPESKGLAALEGWAAGVPTILPAHGAFVELTARAGGGLLYRPGDADDLARALRQLLDDPRLAVELGRRGRQAVRAHYTAEQSAERTLAWYETVLAAARG